MALGVACTVYNMHLVLGWGNTVIALTDVWPGKNRYVTLFVVWGNSISLMDV